MKNFLLVSTCLLLPACASIMNQGNQSENPQVTPQGQNVKESSTTDRKKSSSRDEDGNKNVADSGKAGNGQSPNPAGPKKKVTLLFGYDQYKMESFNDKLSKERNSNINGGLNIGAELEWSDGIKIPDFVPLLKGLSISIPFGFEYLGADSETTHVEGNNQTAVKWNLPVIGIYLPLNIPVYDNKGENWMPKLSMGGSIGLYTVGEYLFDAKLSVNDRPGSLKISGHNLGFKGQIRASWDTFFIESGYRWLKFTDVSLESKDGFVDSPGGNLIKGTSLPQILDYSGLSIKIGLRMEF